MKRVHMKTLLLVVTGLVAAAWAASGATPAQQGRRTPAVLGVAHHTDEIATVSPTWIDALRVIRDTRDDQLCPWSIAYPQVPGAEPFTTALRRMTESRRAVFAGQACEQDTRSHTAELNLHFAFLAASGDVIGVRYTEWWLGGAGDGLSTTTRWYDGRPARSCPRPRLSSQARSGSSPPRWALPCRGSRASTLRRCGPSWLMPPPGPATWTIWRSRLAGTWW
ncbi:hypothetical protein [Nonomuraea sp. NPDC050691]|uniref:hypothetical protein n=1 Tax=Nonomuraea sp. NPDC050691 TaxID=3155661 RepID=UPI0033F8DCB1